MSDALRSGSCRIRPTRMTVSWCSWNWRGEMSGRPRPSRSHRFSSRSSSRIRPISRRPWRSVQPSRDRAGSTRGSTCLRRVIQNHPDRVEARDYLLTALDDSGRIDQMEEELERLPAALVLVTEVPQASGQDRPGQALAGGRRSLPPGPNGRAPKPYRRVPAQPGAA